MRGHVVVLSALLIVACGSSSKGRPDAAAGSDSAPDDADLPGDGTSDDAPIDSAMVDAPVDGMQPSTQVLRINEVNANATNCDLVELRAIAGGTLTGLRLVERKDIVFTFPAMTVAPGALIVVHFGAGTSGPCSNGISDDETTSPDQFPSATYPGNYDGAYDLFTTDAGLTATNNVISVMQTTTVIDAVLLASAATGDSAGDSEDQAAIVAAQNQWQMIGGGVPTGGFVNDDFSAHAALDLDAGGATPAGVSIQRLDNTDDNDKADWNSATVTVQPSTWGALNAGQTPL
ncbi:MAG: hypothetical protein AB7T06_35910 [Kofleriaceae bacterium]